MLKLYKDNNSRKILARLFRDNRRLFFRAAPWFGLLVIAGAAASAGKAYIIKPMLEDALQNPDLANLKKFALMAAGVFLFAAITQLATSSANGFLASRTVLNWRKKMSAALLRADSDFYHYNSKGDILDRVGVDTERLSNLGTSFFEIAKNSCAILALLGLLLYQSPTLGLIAVFLGSLTVPLVLYVGKRKRQIYRKLMKMHADFLSGSEEVISGIDCIKSFSREAHEYRLLGKISKKAASRQLQNALLGGALGGTGQLLQGLAVLGFVLAGGVLLQQQTITLGVFFMSFAVLILVYRHFHALLGAYGSIQTAVPLGERIYFVLDEKPKIKAPPKPRPVKLLVRNPPPGIEFKGVGFRYPSRLGDNHPVLFNELSPTFAAGQTTALVGHSGSGKSSIIKMMLRFFDPDRGKILVNGHDVRLFAPKELRSVFALVAQNSFLFEDTLISNILYARPRAGKKEAKEVCRFLGIEEIFINRLPRGYETYVGPGGVILSGGQSQLVSIARAMLKNAPILLLDEATASVDARLEWAVHRSMKTLSRNRTVVVVAHRLSTVKDADKIYVLEHGKIVEVGRHEQLLENGGVYKEMVKRQLLTAPVQEVA